MRRLWIRCTNVSARVAQFPDEHEGLALVALWSGVVLAGAIVAVLLVWVAS